MPEPGQMMSAVRKDALNRLQGIRKPNMLHEAIAHYNSDPQKNYLREAVLKDEELGASKWSEMLNNAKGNALMTRVMKEGLLSDMASALGVMHDVVIQAVTSMAVARDIIWTIPTTRTSVRIYRRKRGKVWHMSNGPSLVTPGRHDYVDVPINIEKGTDALFTKSYLEDVPYDVIEHEVSEKAQLLEEDLTNEVLDVLEALRTTSNEVASAGDVIAWADVVDVWTKIKDLKRRGKVLICSPTVIGDLFKDDKFIHQFYFGNLVDVARGVLGTTYLGFKIVETDLIGTLGTGATADDPMLVDTDVAAALCIRRDITTEPYKEKLMEGLIATMRYGVKAVDGVTGLAWIDRTG